MRFIYIELSLNTQVLSAIICLAIMCNIQILKMIAVSSKVRLQNKTDL